jgi:hypothetical protein
MVLLRRLSGVWRRGEAWLDDLPIELARELQHLSRLRMKAPSLSAGSRELASRTIEPVERGGRVPHEHRLADVQLRQDAIHVLAGRCRY